ncbi:MAG: TonB-dependent receptor, partial [Planctomycetota bacterium]
GFQAPTSGELDFNLAQADSFAFDPSIDLLLDPEFSTGYDIGIDYVLLDERVRLQATYFNQDVDDLVTFLFVPGAPNFGVFTNIEEFETEGVELALDAQLSPRLRLNAAYTYVDATNVTADIVAGNQPNHRFNAEIAARPTDR